MPKRCPVSLLQLFTVVALVLTTYWQMTLAADLRRASEAQTEHRRLLEAVRDEEAYRQAESLARLAHEHQVLDENLKAVRELGDELRRLKGDK